jgi:hypothetical protein
MISHYSGKRQNGIFDGPQAGWLLSFAIPPAFARRFYVLDYGGLLDPGLRGMM